MCCPPVHLDHPAAVDPSGGDPVADLEGLLEEHEQPRDDLPHGVLQRQAEHDRADAQRGEQTTDVGAPDEREDQRDTDGDQDEPGDVEEDRRNPLAPAAFRGSLEHRRVESGQQQDQDDEAEHRGHHPHGGGIGAHLGRFEQQQQQCPQRQHIIAHQAHRPGQVTVAPQQRVVHLGEHHQRDGKCHRDRDGPPEPWRGEDLGHRWSPERRHRRSTRSLATTSPSAMKSRRSRIASYTGRVT